MFGSLDHFLDEKYFDEHRSGSVIVGNLKYPLIFFAVIETDATETAIFAPTEADMEVLPFIEDNALYYDEKLAPVEGDRMLALSTCKYPSSTERTIIVAKYGKEEKYTPETEEKESEKK